MEGCVRKKTQFSDFREKKNEMNREKSARRRRENFGGISLVWRGGGGVGQEKKTEFARVTKKNKNMFYLMYYSFLTL